MTGTRRKRMWKALAITLAGTVALGAGVDLLFHLGGPLPSGAIAALVAALVGLTSLASLPWWRTLDEMERQAHLDAWWWGGALAGGAVVLGSLVLTFRGDISRSFFEGAALTFLAQAAAYLVLWAVWWARRRPRAAS